MIRCIFQMMWKDFLSNLHKNLCCGCSLESPQRGDSDKHPKPMLRQDDAVAILMNTHIYVVGPH